MSELSPETRAWIDAAGRGDAPREQDRTRIRRRLALQLGVAALATTAVTVTAQAASASVAAGKTGMGLFGKIAIATALAGAVSTTAVIAVRVTRDDSKVATVGAPHVKRAALLERVTAEAPAPQPVVEQLQAVDETSNQAPVVAKRPALDKRAAAQNVVQPAASSIADELVLLREAHSALRAGRPADALEQTREHAARFPRGALHEEREAVEMLALCAQGAATPPMLTAFLQTAPESPLKARVRAACQAQ